MSNALAKKKDVDRSTTSSKVKNIISIYSEVGSPIFVCFDYSNHRWNSLCVLFLHDGTYETWTGETMLDQPDPM